MALAVGVETDKNNIAAAGFQEMRYSQFRFFPVIARQMGAELTEKGNIKVNEDMETTIPGLFAAGDCTGGLPQVAKAVYEGCAAGISAGKYVRRRRKSS